MTGSMLWAATNGASLLLLVMVLSGWARQRRDVHRLAVGGAIAIVLALIATLVWVPSPLPIGWITALHEGRTMRNVQQLHGLGAHAGPALHFLTAWLTGHDASSLSAIAAVNLRLAVVNAIVFFCIAAGVLRSWLGGLAFAVAYVWNVNTLHAALSETPAMLWTIYFWQCCIAGLVLADGGAAIRLRRLALLWLAVLTILVGLVRVELLLMALPALAVAGARVGGGEEALHQLAGRIGAALRALIERPVLLLAVVGALLLIERLPLSARLQWGIAGLQPLNLSFLTLPWALGVFSPVAVIVLFILGWIHALRRWATFCVLPITALVLFKVYVSAAHGTYFETFRYMTFVSPVALFLALFGFRELSEWAQRWAWPAWWHTLALLLLAFGFTVWRPPGLIKEIFSRGHQLPGIGALPAPITRLMPPTLAWNQQSEVRYLLDLLARYPDCVLLVKAAASDATFEDSPHAYRWSAVGRTVPMHREVGDRGAGVQRMAEELAPGAACVLFYRGLDCNLVGSDQCRDEIAGRAPLEEHVLENLPYSDIKEYGAHGTQIRLGIYPVVPPSGG